MYLRACICITSTFAVKPVAARIPARMIMKNEKKPGVPGRREGSTPPSLCRFMRNNGRAVGDGSRGNGMTLSWKGGLRLIWLRPSLRSSHTWRYFTQVGCYRTGAPGSRVYSVRCTVQYGGTYTYLGNPQVWSTHCASLG